MPTRAPRTAGRLLTALASTILLASSPQTAHAQEAPRPAEGTSPAAEEQAALDAKLANAAIPPGPLTFGAEPLAAVEGAAADAAAGASCEITADSASALALAPVWPEVLAGTMATPSPMTLSRYDNQAGLYDPSAPAGRPGCRRWGCGYRRGRR